MLTSPLRQCRRAGGRTLGLLVVTAILAVVPQLWKRLAASTAFCTQTGMLATSHRQNSCLRQHGSDLCESTSTIGGRSLPRTAVRALPDSREAELLDLLRPVALLLYPEEGIPSFVEVAEIGSKPDWSTAADQLVRRIVWDLGDEPPVSIRAMSLQSFCEQLPDASVGCGLVFGVDLPETLPGGCVEKAQAALQQCSSRLFISSFPDGRIGNTWRSQISLGGVGVEELEDKSFWGAKAMLGGYASSAKLKADIEDLWHRKTAEEAVYAMLVLIDRALAPIESMQAQAPVPTFESISRAVDKCPDEFKGCFTEPSCLKSLQCLSSCGLADQSCSYSCIVSYQSEAFTQFSLCALQKNNLLNSKIERPTTPQVFPLESFRGTPMTHQVAEDILVGHFDPERGQRFGWLVAAGSNPAYEQFALQYQLWYRDEKNKFLYHPTFLVTALDGRKLWRERDYNVRRADNGNQPGVWEFSVLDNGIISEEKWHLLGADKDLKWLVLFYIGAARKAAIFYRGCLILTPDGAMPTDAESMQGIEDAISRAGIRTWELEVTSNPPVDPANPPPLIAPTSQPAAPLLVPV